MRTCEMISPYLDGRLESDGRREFEEHLEGCARCAAAVEEWRLVERRMNDLCQGENEFADPTAHEALGLVQRAEQEKSRPSSGTGVPAAAMAASILVAGLLGLGIGYLMIGSPSVESSSVEPVVADGAVTYQTDAHSRTTVHLGADVISLGPSSSLRVVEDGANTRLVLQGGEVACQVADRGAGEGFAVETPDFEVKVVGTRFLVKLEGDRGPSRVVVSEGRVRVGGSLIGDHRLVAGEILEMGPEARVRQADRVSIASLDQIFGRAQHGSVAPVRESDVGAPDAGTASKTDLRGLVEGAQQGSGHSYSAGEKAGNRESGISRWREWVIEGRLDEAAFALREHLKENRSDGDAWSLLADCERKRSKWEEAVNVYEKMIESTGGEKANQARFKAASILQDRLKDHGRVVKLLKEFVSRGDGGSPLAERAKIRLAGSLVTLKKTGQAREYLTQVIDGSNDGTMVARARRMLAELEEK